VFATTRASMPNDASHVAQKCRRHDVEVHPVPHHPPCDRRPAQVIRCLAAVVVEHHRLTKQPSRR